MSAEKMSFYLTQRLTRRDNPARNGFDSLFACQYMGSAEFEWGAIPESLARVRASKRLGVHCGRVTRGEFTVPVFVVGDVGRISAVPNALTEWLADEWPHGKERTYFPEHIEGEVEDWHRDTHAWWSLGADVLWALDADTADRLLLAVRP